MDIRIGYGYDVHRLEQGEELWIGGVLFPHKKGAVGHSDADVLLHAICDAMFGALAMRDIGYHFPDTAPAYKGIDSKRLLIESWKKVSEKGWNVGKCLSRVAEEGCGVVVLLAGSETQQDILSSVDIALGNAQVLGAAVGDRDVYMTVGLGSQILRDLGVGKIRLMGAPIKYNAISGFDLEVTEHIEAGE